MSRSSRSNRRAASGSPIQRIADDRPLPIDSARLQARIDQLGEIGRYPGGGLFRPLYSQPWAEAMGLVEGWLAESGLETRRDAVGNLFGRLAGGESPRVVLTGSHIDTVLQGGKYDGALGILAALAAVEALAQAYGGPRQTLEVVAICEEEGSLFHSDFWGARAIRGLLEPGEAERIHDPSGRSLAEAMRAQGLDPTRLAEAARDDLDAFLELHIEQGRILEGAGRPLGVVETITGQCHLEVVVEGRQDHAGTTPMDLRRDALAGAAEMVARLSDAAAALGRPAVATVGRLEVSPGAVNIVPGRVLFTVDARSPILAQLERLRDEVAQIVRTIAARRELAARIEPLSWHDPVPLDAGLRHLLTETAERAGYPVLSLPSGAGHDSQILAGLTPTAMLFVPSQDGKSHRPDEYTPLEQVLPGVQVLAGALAGLAY